MIDFVRLCHDRNIPLLLGGHHHCHQGWAQTHCPFCGGSEGYHLGFNLESGGFSCWRCGSLGFFDVLSALLKVTDRAELRRIVDKYQTQRRGVHGSERRERAHSIHPPPSMGEMMQPHKEYLLSRGFNPIRLSADWGLKGTNHLGGDWSWRIIIPIYDQEGRTVAYQGRAIAEGVKPKYKMSNEKDILVDPKSILYGIHVNNNSDSVIVVEGVTGVWRLGPGTVATLGINWKLPQANQLRRYKNRFILFDPDGPAQKKAQSLANWLSVFPGVTEVISGFDTDPGDFTPELAEQVRRIAGLPN